MKINRKNDYFFKRVFGHEDTKDILARFLTVVLGVPIEPDELTIVHTELSPEYLADKASVLDIQVRRSKAHEKYNVEMQIADKGNIERRLLHYWGRGYTEEIKEGDDYSSLPRMIIIAVVDFNVFEWRDAAKFHSVFRVLEADEGVLFSDALEIHMLELPKLKRQPLKDNWSPIECWGLYLNNLEGEAMEMITAKEPMIGRALTVEDVFVKNDEERRLYELREKGRLEFENAMFTAERRGELKGELKGKQEGILEGMRKGRQDGIQEGIQEGMRKGRHEGIQTTARSMLARDMPLALISEISGLSVEEIKALK
ncbi:MAG: Rpn family recombination-promoting nuclease/putative transposase [Synergistaceae bacterium]|nr:Rpn family recombination-promoting nuclease/putative transposase [Synergistaceae bacterium]